MKRIYCVIPLSFFIAACANIQVPIVTASPQATSTITPTLTPSVTPTITLTPTQTPDPNMPPDATGQDPLSGEYTKTVTENDNEVTYVWKQIRLGNDVESGIRGHWFKSQMAEGPINLTGYGENYRDSWGKITLNLNVYSIEGLSDLGEIGYLHHPAGKSDYVTNGFESETLSSNVAFDLFRRYSGLIPDHPKTYYRDRFTKFQEKYYAGDATSDATGRDQFVDDWKAFVSALNNGATIKAGNELWEPRKGYEVYIIDEAMAAEDTSMYLNVQGYTIHDFYWKILVNNGKLIAIIAPAKLLKEDLSTSIEQSRERFFRFVTLFPLQAVLTTESLSEDISPYWYQDYGGMAGPGASIRAPTKSVTVTTSFINFMPNP